MEFKKIRADILEKNYSEIPFRLSKENLIRAAESFLDLLTLPENKKDSLYSRWDVGDHLSDVGYIKRKSNEGKDDKEFFHFNEVVDVHFKDIFYKDDKKIKIFLHEARTVYHEAKKTLHALLKIFEGEFPGITKMFFDETSIPFLYLRFLKYDSKEKGKFLARAHYDRGSLTFALAESAPGLRIGRDEKTLREVDSKNKTALFMPAIHFHEITEEIFTPAWHDVVQKLEDRVSRETSRWAIVFFADALHMKTPTMEETHTPKTY